MARLYYHPINGGDDIEVYDDPQILNKADLELQRDALLDVQGLTDELRTLIASNGLASIGLPSFAGQADPLSMFDDYVQDELDRLLDVLDYFDYTTSSARISIAEHQWITPIAIESVSDENVGEEATLAIDEDFGTWWQSDAVGTREIVFELRGYPKKIEQVRLRAPVSDLRAQLQGVTIKAAKALAMIDAPGNVLDTDVDFTYVDNIWLEHVLTTPKFNARYIKLEVATSLHVANPEQVRIREIEVRVGTRNHER